jgi:hypothetical protein
MDSASCVVVDKRLPAQALYTTTIVTITITITSAHVLRIHVTRIALTTIPTPPSCATVGLGEVQQSDAGHTVTLHSFVPAPLHQHLQPQRRKLPWEGCV